MIAVAVVLLIAVVLGILLLRPERAADFTVTFLDFDGTVLKTQTVPDGGVAEAPEEPERAGYTFSGWNKDFSAVSRDLTVTATYTRITETVLTVEQISTSRGVDNAQVKVTVTNNPGILGMLLSVEYDEDALTLVDSQNGAALSALAFQQPSRYASGCNFLWYGSETGGVMDGEALILTFSVAEDAQLKEYPITVSYAEKDIYDGNSDMLAPGLVQGGITVTE